MQGTPFPAQERGPAKTGWRGLHLLQYKDCVFAQTPISPAYSGMDHSRRTEVKGKAEMQRPPPPQDLVSKQEHFNQEIKTQYRLGP